MALKDVELKQAIALIQVAIKYETLTIECQTLSDGSIPEGDSDVRFIVQESRVTIKRAERLILRIKSELLLSAVRRKKGERSK